MALEIGARSALLKSAVTTPAGVDGILELEEGGYASLRWELRVETSGEAVAGRVCWVAGGAWSQVEGVVVEEAEEGTGAAGGGGTGSEGGGEGAGYGEAGDVGDAKGAERELVADGPAGDKGDAQTRLDGREEAFCGVEGHRDLKLLWRDAEGLESGLDNAARARADLAGDEGGGGKIGGGDVTADPVVAGRDDEDHVVFHEGLGLDVGSEGGTFDEGEVNALIGEGKENLFGVAAGALDGEAGMQLEEAGQQIGKEILADGLRGTDAKLIEVCAGGFGDGLGGLVGEQFEAIGEAVEDCTGGSEGHAAAGAIEEGGAELIFESLDVLRDGGLGEEELFGGLAEAEALGHGSEDAKTEVLHDDGCCSAFSIAWDRQMAMRPERMAARESEAMTIQRTTP